MKKRIENIKKQAGREGKRLMFVLAGFITGRAFSAGMNLLSEKFPEYADWFNYSKAPAQGLGGFLLCSASTDEEEFAKHFGYGLGASAMLEGIKIIPVAKDYLGELDLEKTYYREDDKPALSIGNFGIKSLPVKSVEIGEIPPIEVDLPDLESKDSSSNLGYSGSITEDADLKGLL